MTCGLLALATWSAAPAAGQAADSDVQKGAPAKPAASAASHLSARTTPDPGPIDYPMPQITVMAPPQPQANWALHDRVSWAANLVLALLGYAALWIALSTLKKIERQTKLAEEEVSLAASTARTALLHVEAVIRAERPWIMVTAEPSPDRAGSSIVVATNRGKSPARIVAMTDKIQSAVDEAHLSPDFDVTIGEQSPAMESVILLPGESTAMRMFGREDLERFCANDEALERVENWEEKVFITGKVVYKDLNAPDDGRTHETPWACWYICGQKKSGLVTIGLPGWTVLT